LIFSFLSFALAIPLVCEARPKQSTRSAAPIGSVRQPGDRPEIVDALLRLIAAKDADGLSAKYPSLQFDGGGELEAISGKNAMEMVAACKMASENASGPFYTVEFSCPDRVKRATGCNSGNVRLAVGQYDYGTEILFSEMRKIGGKCKAFVPTPVPSGAPNG